MRRRPPSGGRRTGPTRLHRFNPDDWQGETVLQRYDEYSDAVRAYQDAHPGKLLEVDQIGDLPFDPEKDI